ncbi:hypothetical protein [Helicobacter trogontum]|uniref:Uncharacterized protein n=1 Tax=Helicobacter trogontum TaxID=50960 RepID=A0A4U8TB18_9HELI|nr:hypothetical protein [Helicobacter trogontum]MCI5786660.1 hypothetical protein [Helicobacter trogontum]MDY5186162.1 hypothetical protein [Helicobacter trogontum]TLD97071.1 hypothetical protein LS80_007445 [Helicobacter trogontum]
MVILTLLFTLAVLVAILIRFGILKKVIKWVLSIVVCFGIITCIGVFIFLDDIKEKTQSQYENYRIAQIHSIIPQECIRTGIDKRICEVYMQRLYGLMEGKISGLYVEKTWDNYIFGAEAKSDLAKKIASIMVAEGRNFVIAQARIDKNVCNTLSGMFQYIDPDEFACEKADITMKELGGFLYDLKYLFLLAFGQL